MSLININHYLLENNFSDNSEDNEDTDTTNNKTNNNNTNNNTNNNNKDSVSSNDSVSDQSEKEKDIKENQKDHSSVKDQAASSGDPSTEISDTSAQSEQENTHLELVESSSQTSSSQLPPSKQKNIKVKGNNFRSNRSKKRALRQRGKVAHPHHKSHVVRYSRKKWLIIEQNDKYYKNVMKFSAGDVEMSARKARLVVDMIRYKSLEDAAKILIHNHKKAAFVVSKLLRSAMASIINDYKMSFSISSCIILRAYVNEGPTRKRIRHRAQGRAMRVRKRTCKIVVEVCELKNEL